MIKLTCCSTIDLDKDTIKNLDLTIIPFHYYVNGEEHVDDMYSSISPKEFFEIVSKNDVTTSQASPEQYESCWTKFLEEGNDILHISFSSGVSGAYNTCLFVKNMLSEKYPDRKIEVIDSLNASIGYGWLVLKALDKIKSGVSFEEAVDFVKNEREHLQALFYSSDLSQFVKGGRISKVEGTVGSILNICPYMSVTKDGKLKVIGKARGKKKVREQLIELIKSNIKNGLDYDGEFLIGHSDIEEEAIELRKALQEVFTKAKFDEKIADVGPTVGCHTGRGTVEVHYECINRM